MAKLPPIAVLCVVGFLSVHAAEGQFEALKDMRPSLFERGAKGHFRWSQIQGQSLIKIDPELLSKAPEEAVRQVLNRTREATGAPEGIELEVMDQSKSFPKEVSFYQTIDGARVGGSGSMTFDRQGNVQEIDMGLIDPESVTLPPATILEPSAVLTARQALQVHLESNDIAFGFAPGSADHGATLIYRTGDGGEFHPYWIVTFPFVKGPDGSFSRYSVQVDAVSSEAVVLPPAIIHANG